MMKLSCHRRSRCTSVALVVAATVVLSWNLGPSAKLVSNPPHILEFPSLLFVQAKPGEEDRNRDPEGAFEPEQGEVADEGYPLRDDKNDTTERKKETVILGPINITLKSRNSTELEKLLPLVSCVLSPTDKHS
jgi:hypothetical protein